MRFLRRHISELALGIIFLPLGLMLVETGNHKVVRGYIAALVGGHITIILFRRKSRKSHAGDSNETEVQENVKQTKTEPKQMRKDTMKIYIHWKRIKHSKLRDLARDEIYRCKRYVKQLKEGKIEDRAYRIFATLPDEINKAKCVRAVHVVRKEGDIKTWFQEPMARYQEHIKKVAQEESKTQVERIFILSRNLIAHPQMLSAVREIMERQRADGIKIMVVWEDVVKDRSLVENWVVIDDRVVEYGSEAGECSCNDWLNREVTLSYNDMEAKFYYQKFEFLKAFAKQLDKWLADNTGCLPPDPSIKDETHSVN